MYRTQDSTQAQSYTNSKLQATAKLLSSLKCIVHNGKNTSSKQNIKTKEVQIPVKQEHADAWHLSTFSSPEQLAEIKEKQVQAAHEAMLKKELAKFRSEVEEKFRASETNRNFRFPRAEYNDDFNGDNEDTVKIDNNFDCIF